VNFVGSLRSDDPTGACDDDALSEASTPNVSVVRREYDESFTDPAEEWNNSHCSCTSYDPSYDAWSQKSYDAEHLYFSDSEADEDEAHELEGADFHMQSALTLLLTAVDNTLPQAEVEAIECLLKCQAAEELELAHLHCQLLACTGLHHQTSEAPINASCQSICDFSFLKICDDGGSLHELSEGDLGDLAYAVEQLRVDEEMLSLLLLELRDAVSNCDFRSYDGCEKYLSASNSLSDIVPQVQSGMEFCHLHRSTSINTSSSTSPVNASAARLHELDLLAALLDCALGIET